MSITRSLTLPASPVPSPLHGGSSMVAWPVSYRTRLSAFPPLPPPPPLSPGPNVVSYDRRLSVWLEKWSSRSGRINPFSLRPWTTLNRIWQLTPQKKGVRHIPSEMMLVMTR